MSATLKQHVEFRLRKKLRISGHACRPPACPSVPAAATALRPAIDTPPVAIATALNADSPA
jgi:hypothetical protein